MEKGSVGASDGALTVPPVGPAAGPPPPWGLRRAVPRGLLHHPPNPYSAPSSGPPWSGLVKSGLE
ncbi:hypothetical protein JCM4914_36710 [Streptomyces platensis subsp. malvinus]